MTKSNVQKALICISIILILLVLLYSQLAQAQGDLFGSGDYSCKDCYTKKDLVAHWDFSPGISGNDVVNGDFESGFAGSHGTCTDCPSATWSCLCDGTSDVNPSTTAGNFFEGNTGISMFDGDSSAQISMVYTFEANTTYMFSWKQRGAVGGQEDYNVTIRNSGETDYYDADTDTWGANDSQAFTDISGSWSTGTITVVTVGAAKTDYVILFVTNSADDTIYFDDFKIQKWMGTITSDQGHVLSIDDQADPLFESTHSRLPIATLNGSTDYFERADDDTFDPATYGGNFSVGCRFLTPDITTGGYLIMKDGANRDWAVWTGSGDDFSFNWWDTDGTGDSLSKAGALTNNARYSGIVTFENIVDTGSTVKVYITQADETTDVAAQSPIRNEASVFNVGGKAANKQKGTMESCDFWGRNLTESEARCWMSPYYKGNDYGPGISVNTCVHATPPDVCSNGYCRPGASHNCESQNEVAYSSFGSNTEKAPNNSFENITSETDFDDWTEQLTAGDGTSQIRAYRADKRAGDISARMTLTGTTSIAKLLSGCLTTDIGADAYVYAYIKKIKGSGVTTTTLLLVEYDSATCTTQLNSNALAVNQDITNTGNIGGLVAAADWHGDTSSYQVHIIESSDNNPDIWVDAVSIKAESYFTPWYENSGAGTTSSTGSYLYVDNPLAIDIHDGNSIAATAGFCMGGWVYSDWSGDGTTTKYMLYIDGTAGNTNSIRLFIDSTDTLIWRLYDSATTLQQKYLGSVTNTEWTANAWHYVEACYDDGTMNAHHYNVATETWHSWSSATGAAATITAVVADLDIGVASTITPLDGYIKSWFVGPEVGAHVYNTAWYPEQFGSGKIARKPY